MENKIVEIARKYIGVKEEPVGSNRTQFGKWFGLDGSAWCGMFASFVYNEAGYPLGTIDFKKGYASCQFALNHFQKHGEVVTKENAQPGNLTIFDWDGNGHADHTGIFIRDLGDGSFECIEGNTGIGNDSNGGEVMLRVRKYTSGKMKVHFIAPRVVTDNELV
jgi:hypothetical protein